MMAEFFHVEILQEQRRSELLAAASPRLDAANSAFEEKTIAFLTKPSTLSETSAASAMSTTAAAGAALSEAQAHEILAPTVILRFKDVFAGSRAQGFSNIPVAGVVHVVLSGHGNQEAGAWQRSIVDRELARGPGPVFFFSDVEHLSSHDAIFREEMTKWQGRVCKRVTQLVLFRSRLVVLAISIANRLSGGGTEVTSSRIRFEHAMADAIAAAQRRALQVSARDT